MARTVYLDQEPSVVDLSLTDRMAIAREQGFSITEKGQQPYGRSNVFALMLRSPEDFSQSGLTRPPDSVGVNQYAGRIVCTILMLDTVSTV